MLIRSVLAYLIFALACGTAIAAAPVKMPANAPKDIELAVKLLQSPEGEERGQAAYWVASLGEEAKPAVALLIKLLNDPLGPMGGENYTAYGPTSPAFEARNALGNLGKTAEPELLDMLKDPDPKARRNAAGILSFAASASRSYSPSWISVKSTVMRALVEMKCREVEKPLLDALKSDDRGMRLSAMSNLELLGTDNAIDSVIAALKDDGWKPYEIERHIENLRSPKAVDLLIGFLDNKEEQLVLSAVSALGEIGDKRAIEPLRKLIKGRKWSNCSSAARALVKLGDHYPVDALIQALASDKPDIDVFTAEAISAANDKALTDAALSAIEAKRNMRLAVRSLKKSTDPRVLPVMASLLMLKDESVVTDAVEYLGANKTPAAVDALIAGLKHGDETCRDRIAYSLAGTGDKRAIGPLSDAFLAEGKGRPRSAMMNALARLGAGPQMQGTLITALKDEEPSVRWEAAGLLGTIKSSESVAALIGALKDKNPGVRSMAAESLGKIGTKAAVKALIAELMDPDSYIRPDAVRALGASGSKDAEPYIQAALNDNSDAVRRQAAEALTPKKSASAAGSGRMSQPAMSIFDKGYRAFVDYDPAAFTVPQLIKMLQDPDPIKRSHAAGMLQVKKDKSAVEPLIEAMVTDTSVWVFQRAVSALQATNDPRAVAAMLDYLKSPQDPRVDPKPEIMADRAVLNGLIDLLGDADKDVVSSAQDSLHTITLQDFGTDKTKWSKWVEGNVPR